VNKTAARAKIHRLPSRGRSRGKVVLVGAGPGDPELITVRGLRWLRSADVVLHDRLVHPTLVAQARPDARRIFVGKPPGKPRLRQANINRLLIAHARRGRLVVRLKGGDPFVFGRGGEEMIALARASIPFEVVPGVTSAVAVPASAGIPLTHRGTASSFAVVTGHRADGGFDGEGIGGERVSGRELGSGDRGAGLAAVDTLVVLMGVGHLARIVTSLLTAGRNPETPVAVIENGTLPEQRIVTATLADIVPAARRTGIGAPATIVIGEVVRLHELCNGAEKGADAANPAAAATAAALHAE
jgi:uroporphyrin-III C-methyltransferase